MISSISLLNWRSHANTTLTFSKGTNLLLGSMGSGKSSVLCAISFALFGTFPQAERRKISLEDVLRLNEDNASVILEFTWGNSKYKVERKITKDKRGTSTDAYVYRDGALLDKGTKAVTSYVENCIDVDYDLFTRSAYSEQNNIDYFLTVDPKRRKEEIDVLLGLDKFETARTNAVSVVNRVRSNIKALEGRFNHAVLRQNVEKKAALEKIISETSIAFAAAESGLLEQKQKAVLLEKGYLELKKTREIFESLNKDEIKYAITIENLKKEIVAGAGEKEVEHLKHSKQEMEKTRAEMLSEEKTLEAKSLRISRNSAELEGKIKLNEKNKTELTRAEKTILELLAGGTIEQLKEKASQTQKTVIETGSQLVSFRARIKELEALSDKLSTEASKCPLCGCLLTKEGVAHVMHERKTALEENKKKAAELEQSIPKARMAYEKLTERIRNIELAFSHSRQLKDSISDVAPFKTELLALSGHAKIISAKRETAAKHNQDISKELEKLAVKISQAEATVKKKESLKLAEEKLAQTKEKLSTIIYEPKIYEEKRSMLEMARIEIEKLSAVVAQAKNSLASSKELLLSVSGEIGRMQSLENEIAYLAKLDAEFIIYKTALLETQLSLRANLVEAINLAMNEIWHIFYPHRNYKGIRLNVSEKDYSIEVNDGAWKALESVASGGERACAVLTLRVALATVLTPKLGLLILDEPTHNLDKEAIELLSNTLQFKVPSIIDQVFIISHDEALTGSDFATSYRLTRDKANFGATLAERV